MPRPARRLSFLPALAILAGLTVSLADERLEGIACRSVHLVYPAAEGVAFLNEITIDQSAPGTYFMVCGWNKGYFGLQELSNGKKLLIFSVWDSEQNDPKAVEEDRRTRLLYKDEKVRTGRFGGEGTGGQSFFDYDWKVGATYRLMVSSRVDGNRTEYTGYFFEPERHEWRRLVTFSTVTGGRDLGGYYSFIEDFKRDRVSTTRARKAHFGIGYIWNKKGELVELARARFIADANPVNNIDAGLNGTRFFLVTGGETRNTGTKLRDTMNRPDDPARSRPENLPRPEEK